MEHSKVYVVMRGLYEPSIEGVYSTRELADASAATIDESHVSEWELDQNAEALLSGRVPFAVMGHDSDSGNLSLLVGKTFDDDFSEDVMVTVIEAHKDTYLQYAVGVYAKDRSSALEMAEEMIMKWKAVNCDALSKMGVKA